MPIEYYYYIYLVDESANDEVENLFLKLQEVLSKKDDELQKKGEMAKKFVLTEKNNIIQTKKVLDMFINL